MPRAAHGLSHTPIYSRVRLPYLTPRSEFVRRESTNLESNFGSPGPKLNPLPTNPPTKPPLLPVCAHYPPTHPPSRHFSLSARITHQATTSPCLRALPTKPPLLPVCAHYPPSRHFSLSVRINGASLSSRFLAFPVRLRFYCTYP